MLRLSIDNARDLDLRVLCLGSHSDDIEIGCGGTILKIVEDNRKAAFYWVVFSSDEKRKREAEESANIFLSRTKGKTIIIMDFKDGFFPYEGKEIKEYFEQLKREFKPNLIFTHYRMDLHQDHRLISELTWNTFRDHLILEYEIPKYDGDLGCPNYFVHLKRTICARKIENVLNTFKSQRKNQWFNQETFQSIMRLRGIESNSPHKYAEAFYCRKIIGF